MSIRTVVAIADKRMYQAKAQAKQDRGEAA